MRSDPLEHGTRWRPEGRRPDGRLSSRLVKELGSGLVGERREAAGGERLGERVRELSERAGKRGLDWKSRLKDVPDDPLLRVAALATLLEIDALAAMKSDVELDSLEEEAKAAREAARQGEQEMRVDLKRQGLIESED